ncbi:B12-binding domain-containing radical SAM protein [Candidatus Micrarchaeota archaeon]|nr:B12-binding domain-containing radical SAM protein [Candidatus Micrarchaeota archaeon]
MKVVLINAPWYFRTEPVLSQNLALGYVGAYLEKAGHKVEFIDALAEGFSERRTVEGKGNELREVGLTYGEIAARIPGDAGLICLSAPFTNHAQIVKGLALELKRHFPRVPVVVGGIYPSTMKEDALTEGIDFAVVGEGERPLTELADGMEPGNIKGLLFRRGGKIVSTGRASPAENLDTLPFPARHLMPMDKYARHSPRARLDLKTASVITSRGCPFDCSFCSVHSVCNHKWRPRSAKNVIAEIKEIVREYGIEHIEFEDDNLTLDRKRAVEIFNSLAELNNELHRPITWAAPNGVWINSLDREMLALMRKSGCVGLNLALEHGSEEMIKKMNKHVNREKVVEVVKLCKEFSIPISVFVIVGYPGETAGLFEEGLEFLKVLRKAGAKRFLPFFLQPYPGTRVFDYCKKKGYLLNPEGDVFYGVDEPSIATEDFDAAELRKRKKRIEHEANSAVFRYEGIIRRIVPRKILLMLKRGLSI